MGDRKARRYGHLRTVPTRLEAEMKDDEDYYVRRNHGRVMLGRIGQLMDAGYRVDPGHHLGEFELALRHPNKTVPPLALWDDGLINDLDPLSTTPVNERAIFEPEDEQGFRLFLRTIPKPNWIQRQSITPLGEALQTALALLLLLAVLFAMVKCSEAVGNWGRNTLGI